MSGTHLLALALVFLSQTAQAQVTAWQLGGSQPWAGQDTVSIMVDFDSVDEHVPSPVIRKGTPVRRP